MNRPFLALLLAMGGSVPSLAAYSWSSLPVGGGGFVSGVTASRQEKNLIYARTDVGGAYRWNQSTGGWDALTDWAPADNRGVMGITSIALDRQDPARLYMVAGISYFENGKTVLLRSGDRGASFERVDLTAWFRVDGNGNGRHLGSRLAVDPNLPTRLIAGSGSSVNGAFLSEDRGTTWKQIVGLPTNSSVSFVAFDSATSSKGKATATVYVGLTRARSGGTQNLYRSTDGGINWSPITSLDTLIPQQGMVADDGTLIVTYANTGILEHSNKGSIWKLSRTGTAVEITPKDNAGAAKRNPWSGIDCMPGNAKRLIITSINSYGTPQCWTSSVCSYNPGQAAWGEAVMTSDDQGVTWKDQMSGFGNPSGKAVKLVSETNGPTWAEKAQSNVHWSGGAAFDPFDLDRAFVTSGQGIFRASGLTTNSVQWNFSAKGIEELVTNEFIPVAGGTKLSAVWDYDGVRWPANGGYAPAKFQPSAGHNTSLTVASAAPRWVARLGNGTSSILLSSDSGKTWTSVTRPTTTVGGQVLFNRDGTSLLYTVGSLAWRSTNQGVTWTAVSWPGSTGGRLAADAVNPKLLYLCGGDGKLWVSVNAGASFAAMATLPTAWNSNPRLAPVLGRAGELWFAAGQGSADGTKLARYSVNATTGAATLMSAYKSGNWWENVTQIGIGKAAPGHSYPALYAWGNFAGTTGIFRSNDTGATWTRINDDAHQYGGPGNGQFVTGDPDVYGRVYFGTFGRGVVVGDPVNLAPTVTLALSAKTMTQAGSIKATLTGADADGQISGLTLLVDGKIHASSTSTPWIATLSGLSIGTHTVQAKVTDDLGTVGASAVASIAVTWDYALSISTTSNWFGGLTATYKLPTTVTSATIQIVSAAGAVVRSATVAAGSIRTRFTSVSGLASGVYSVRLVSGTKTLASRPVTKL